MQPSAIPELTKAGQVGYIDYLTAGGSTELMAADLVQVGTTVSVVAIDGPLTNDPAALQQMGGTQLAHLSDVQVGRLKSAQGPELTKAATTPDSSLDVNRNQDC